MRTRKKKTLMNQENDNFFGNLCGERIKIRYLVKENLKTTLSNLVFLFPSGKIPGKKAMQIPLRFMDHRYSIIAFFYNQDRRFTVGLMMKRIMPSIQGGGLYRRIYLFFIHSRSHDGGTFLALVACGIPCFPVTLLGGFVYNRIIMKAGRTGEPDNVPGSCSYNLLF